MELLVDGKRTFVATEGRQNNPALPVITFIHGVGLDHTIWVLPMRYFTRHGRNVLAFDLPGHGRSAGPPLASIETLGDWLVRVLNAVGIERAALVGYSMGALVTLAAAARHPKYARTLVMLGPSAPMPVHERLLAAAKADDHSAIDMLNLWGHSAAGQIGGIGAPGLWKVGGALRLWERAATGVIYADLKACNDYSGGPAHAAAVQCSALLIIADHDIMTPAAAGKRLVGAFAEARAVIIANSGHAMLEEQPNAVLDALIEVL